MSVGHGDNNFGTIVAFEGVVCFAGAVDGGLLEPVAIVGGEVLQEEFVRNGLDIGLVQLVFYALVA